MPPRLPRSMMQRQAVLNRTMLTGAGGGRSAVVMPEPRPLPPPEVLAAAGAAAFPGPFYVVASELYSSDRDIAVADYLCDGTDDHVEINQAIADADFGGVVFLCSGLYNVGNAAGVVLTEGITLMGADRTNTEIRHTGSGVKTGAVVDTDLAYEYRITNLTIKAGGVALSTGPCVLLDGSSGMIDNCYLQTPGGTYPAFKDVAGSYGPSQTWIVDNFLNGQIQLVGTGFDTITIARNFGGSGFDIAINPSTVSGGFELFITGNECDALSVEDCFEVHIDGNHCGGAAALINVDDLVFANNHCSSLAATNCDIATFAGNVVYAGATLTTVADAAIDGNYIAGELILDTCHDVAIAGNDGSLVQLDTCTNVILDSNMLRFSGGGYAVWLQDSDDCVVSNNLCISRAGGDRTGAVIELLGDSDRCHVHGNTGRRNGGPSATQADYFVLIGASCNDTKCWGNDGFGMWDIAAISDLGTGTDLTTANR